MSTETLTQGRYEYGRHETFAVRHGWLGKGLSRMDSSPAGFNADETAVVELGLGSRMVKSLRYWLEASGVGELRSVEVDGRKVRELHTSALGRVVQARDPFMEYPATWWFVHLNLARCSGSVWSWFFNDFRERLFERPTCVEAYLRHLRINAANEPTLSLAQRDIACLLAAYGTASANEPRDPEDGTALPLRGDAVVIDDAVLEGLGFFAFDVIDIGPNQANDRRLIEGLRVLILPDVVEGPDDAGVVAIDGGVADRLIERERFHQIGKRSLSLLTHSIKGLAGRFFDSLQQRADVMMQRDVHHHRGAEPLLAVDQRHDPRRHFGPVHRLYGDQIGVVDGDNRAEKADRTATADQMIEAAQHVIDQPIDVFVIPSIRALVGRDIATLAGGL